MKKLDLGIYSVSLKQTVRLFKQDLTDDWFKDPLHYEDKLKDELILNYFEKNIQENDGIYNPSDRIVLNLPKKHGTLRYSLETNFYDRIAFHALGLTLIKYFDPLISKRVFSHRLNIKELNKDKPRYLFYNSITQWKKFEEFTKIDNEDKAILITDVQNYFEHININILNKIFMKQLTNIKVDGRIKGELRFCIESMSSCLSKWSFNSDNGLPQNRDISSFLANIYMLPIDNYMIDLGYDYYRYMDDIRIVTSDKYEARNALKVLSIKLREYNLTLNGFKTEILEPESDDHTEYFSKDGIELERIDAMFNSKRKPIVALAFKDVKKGIDSCIKRKEFDSREFRFFLGRISKIALCDDIEKPNDYFDNIKKEILDSLLDSPTNTDSFYNLLISVELSNRELLSIQDFLLDTNKAIYSWQNYLLWKILIHHNYKSDALLKFAKAILNQESKIAMKSGAIIYIGKLGSDADKIEIIKNINNDNDFMTQRHYLIAMQKVEFKHLRDITKYISDENNYTYRELKAYPEPKYLIPPKKIEVSELFNQVGFYA